MQSAEKQKPVDESTVDLSAYRVVKEMTGDRVEEIHDIFEMRRVV